MWEFMPIQWWTGRDARVEPCTAYRWEPTLRVGWSPKIPGFWNAHWAIGSDYRHCFPTGKRSDILPPEAVVFYKQVEEEIVATIVLRPEWWTTPTSTVRVGVVDFLCVHPDWRGVGLASIMINALGFWAWRHWALSVFVFMREVESMRFPALATLDYWYHPAVAPGAAPAAEVLTFKSRADWEAILRVYVRSPGEYGRCFRDAREFAAWASRGHVLLDPTTGFVGIVFDAHIEGRVAELAWSNALRASAAVLRAVSRLGFSGLIYAGDLGVPGEKVCRRSSGRAWVYLHNWGYTPGRSIRMSMV